MASVTAAARENAVKTMIPGLRKCISPSPWTGDATGFQDPFFPARSFGLGPFSNPFIAASRGTGDMKGGLRKPWDALEDMEALRLRVDMAGLGKEDVQVYAEENTLVIKGEAQSEAELDGSGRRYSSRIDLPPKLYRIDQIKAEYRTVCSKSLFQRLGKMK
eukprot:Gb_01039 [translate_table: standard]